MSRKSPAVEAAVPICKELHCPIAAWGTDSLVVEIEDSGRLKDLKSRLAPLGFHFHPDEASQEAGLYDFSLSSESVRKRTNQFQGQEVIRLPFVERYQFLLIFLVSTAAVVGVRDRFDGRVLLLLFLLPIFFVCSIRNFTWKIAFVTGGINIGSLFSNRIIRWSEIASIEKKDYGRMTEGLVFKLRSKRTIKTPGMRFIAAGELRDEIKRRREACLP